MRPNRPVPHDLAAPHRLQPKVAVLHLPPERSAPHLPHPSLPELHSLPHGSPALHHLQVTHLPPPPRAPGLDFPARHHLRSSRLLPPNLLARNGLLSLHVLLSQLPALGLRVPGPPAPATAQWVLPGWVARRKAQPASPTAPPGWPAAAEERHPDSHRLGEEHSPGDGQGWRGRPNFLDDGPFADGWPRFPDSRRDWLDSRAHCRRDGGRSVRSLLGKRAWRTPAAQKEETLDGRLITINISDLRQPSPGKATP